MVDSRGLCMHEELTDALSQYTNHVVNSACFYRKPYQEVH